MWMHNLSEWAAAPISMTFYKSGRFLSIAILNYSIRAAAPIVVYSIIFMRPAAPISMVYSIIFMRPAAPIVKVYSIIFIKPAAPIVKVYSIIFSKPAAPIVKVYSIIFMRPAASMSKKFSVLSSVRPPLCRCVFAKGGRRRLYHLQSRNGKAVLP